MTAVLLLQDQRQGLRQVDSVDLDDGQECLTLVVPLL